MTNSYSIGVVDGITIVRFHRPPSVDILYRAIDEVTKHYPNKKRLWDIDCGLNLTEHELRQVAEFGKEKNLPVGSRAAIVASTDLAYGLSRMYEAFSYEERVEHGVFRTEAEALEWLNSRALD